MTFGTLRNTPSPSWTRKCLEPWCWHAWRSSETLFSLLVILSFFHLIWPLFSQLDETTDKNKIIFILFWPICMIQYHINAVAFTEYSLLSILSLPSSHIYIMQHNTTSYSKSLINTNEIWPNNKQEKDTNTIYPKYNNIEQHIFRISMMFLSL